MADEPPFKKTMEFAYGELRQLYPGVQRIVCNNPGPFTFKGTNTYIVGAGSDVALIDPGPEDAAHLEATIKGLGSRRLTHIIITHTHRDHVDGLPALKARTGATVAGFGRVARPEAAHRKSPSGGEAFDGSFIPDIHLKDGDRLEAAGVTLTAIHTPGHAPDHLCLALEGTGILFSGDHVMSWNTSVVAPPEGHMGDYMRGLERLLARTGDTVYLPGHGGRFEQPQRLVRAFIVHRRVREQAILDCIRAGHGSVKEIVPIVYRGLDARLLNAAALSVQAHVQHLMEQRRVASAGPLSPEARLSPL